MNFWVAAMFFGRCYAPTFPNSLCTGCTLWSKGTAILAHQQFPELSLCCPSTSCRLWIPMYKHLDLWTKRTLVWVEPDSCCDQCSQVCSFHLPSVAMKCIRDQAAIATAKTKTRIVNRFACRSSLAASAHFFFGHPRLLYQAKSQDPESCGTRNSTRSGIHFFLF